MSNLGLDLYYVKTNSYTKFEVNISKDCREKSGKLKGDRLTDRRTDSEQTKSPPASRKGTKNNHVTFVLTPVGLGKCNNSCKSRSSKTKLKLGLYYVMTNSYTKEANISKNCREKSGKLNFSKGTKSYKRRSSVTKLELDLYYVTTNSYTKFEVNFSKDSREKSGKLKCDRLTDRRTDSEQTKSPPAIR